MQSAFCIGVLTEEPCRLSAPIMSLPQDGGTENAMDRKIRDILNGREENYIFPFYWQRGDHTHLIPEQMKRIYSSGCRAVCVESRPHPDFCGESWWRDFGLILQEAKSWA